APVPLAAGKVRVAVAVAGGRLLPRKTVVGDLIERNPLGEGLVAQVGERAGGRGERAEHRRHADRDDRQCHEHLDERESTSDASHRFTSTMGCCMTWPFSSCVMVTLRMPPSRSSVAAKLVRSPLEKIITCGVLSLASLGRVRTTGRASMLSLTARPSGSLRTSSAS